MTPSSVAGFADFGPLGPAGAGNRVVLGLGSNLGNRLALLRSGVESLARVVEVEAVSSVYESEPVGYLDQGNFLNAICVAWTSSDPVRLLHIAQEVEATHGRERPFMNAPRTLDIDLLFYGQVERSDPELTLPHPRWRERPFVLGPLAEVADELGDLKLGGPLTGVTVRALWDADPGSHDKIRKVAPSTSIWRSR